MTTGTAATTITPVGAALLHGYGRIDWTTAHDILHDCSCTWTDLDGIHLTEGPPAHRPEGATHLWAWSRTTSRLARLRFDGDEAAYAAVLSDRPDPRAVLTEPVTTYQRAAVTRHPDDHRAGRLPETVRQLRWTVTEIPGAAPTVFFRAAPAR